MSKYVLNLASIALVSGSFLVFGSAQTQAMPKVSEASSQNIDIVHSTSSSAEATSSSPKTVTIAERSETASNLVVDDNTAVQKLENHNPRIPCVSRIFPSLMQ